MSILAQSLTGRATVKVARFADVAWRHSAVGRVLGWMWSLVLEACGGSAFFSLRSSRGRTMAEIAGSDSPFLLRAMALPVLWLERTLGEGAVGKGMRRAGGAVSLSVLLGGVWVRVLGALAAGFGAGWLSRSSGSVAEVVGASALLLTGCVAVLAGPALVPGWGGSLLVRLAGAFVGTVESSGGSPRARAGWHGRWREGWAPLGVALVLLAALVGLVCGRDPGWTGLVSIAAACAAVAVLFTLYRPEALLLVLAAFPWVNWLARRAFAGSPLAGASDDLLLVGSLFCLLVCVLVTRRWDLRTVPLTLPLLVAVVAAIGSIRINGVPKEVGIFALRVTFEPLLFYFLGFLLPKDRRWVKMAVAVFLLASLMLALHGIYQYLTHAPMPARWVDARETSIATRAYSIVENPNGLGAFLLLGSLLSLSLALGRVAWRQRVLMGGVTLVLVAGLVVTFSRGAWLGFIVGVIAMLALSRPKWLAGLAVLGALSPLVLPRAIVGRLTFAFSSEYLSKSSNNGRLRMWNASLFHIVEQPLFGVGLGAFGGTSAYLFGYSKLWVDSFYLQLAAEGGLILFFAFLWMLLRAGKGVVACRRSARDPYLRAVGAGIFGGLAAVAFANLTTGVWETLVVGAGFWFLAGLGGSLPVGDQEDVRLSRVRDLTARPPRLRTTEVAASSSAPGAEVAE